MRKDYLIVITYENLVEKRRQEGQLYKDTNLYQYKEKEFFYGVTEGELNEKVKNIKKEKVVYEGGHHFNCTLANIKVYELKLKTEIKA